MSTRTISCIAAVLCLAATAARAAEFRDLLGRVPGEANALVVVDVEKILNSPLGQREGWRTKLSDAYANKPVVVLPGTRRVVMAALLDPGSADSIWEVSIMDVDKPPAIDAVAKAEKGYADTLGDKPAAWSPINAYFVQLDPSVFGAVCPANRQFAARWARQKQTLGGAFVSTYLRLAAAAVDQGTEVVMALDLEDVTSAPKVHRRLRQEPFESLEGKQVDVAALAKLLASIKGLTLRIEVGEDISGKGVIEFGADTAVLGDLAQPLLLELLGKAGMGLPDFENWKVTVRGKNVTAEGKLTSEGFRNLLSVVNPPAPAQLIAATAKPAAPAGQEPGKEPPPKPGADQKADVVAATQQYYQTVTKILDNLETKIGTGSKGASLADSANWTGRDARRIDRLPILNVDRDLVAWGGEVSSRLKEIGGIMEVGGIQTRARTSGIQNTNTYGDPYYDPSAGERVAGIDGQRRQAAQEEKVKAYEAAGKIIREMRGSRAKIRAMLTDRYGAEF